MDRLAGRALNLGGGPENAVSLLEVLEHIQALTGERIALGVRGAAPGRSALVRLRPAPGARGAGASAVHALARGRGRPRAMAGRDARAGARRESRRKKATATAGAA